MDSIYHLMFSTTSFSFRELLAIFMRIDGT